MKDKERRLVGATIRAVQLTAIYSVGAVGASVMYLVAKEQRPEPGLAFNQNMEGDLARERLNTSCLANGLHVVSSPKYSTEPK